MTSDKDTKSIPSADAVIAEIEHDIAAAHENCARRLEDYSGADLCSNLEAVNNCFMVTPDAAPGLKGFLHTLQFRVFGPVAGQLSEFHARIVAVLNEMVQSSRDAAHELDRRITEYDELNIESRLRALEKKAGGDDSAKGGV